MERSFNTYQVAKLLGATPGAVMEWIQKGELAVQETVGGPVRILESGLVEFAQARGMDADDILARAGIHTPASPQGAMDLPRLDPLENADALQAGEVETIERMFPLEVEVSPQAPPAAPEPVEQETAEQAGEEAEPWLESAEQPAVSSVEPPTPAETEAEEALAPTAEEAEPTEPELLEASERQALLGEVELTAPALDREGGQGPAAPPPAEVAAEPAAIPPPEPQMEELVAPLEEPAPVAEEGTPPAEPISPAPAEPAAVAEEAAPEPEPIWTLPAADDREGAAVALIRDAWAHRASEIHIEPTPMGLNVRLRIDGALHDAACCGVDLSASQAALAIPQLRALAGLEHADARRPADGQAHLVIDKRAVAVTIATCPTTLGQRMVVSLRNRQAAPPGLALLGLEAEAERRLARVLAGPCGLVVLAARPGEARMAALEAMVVAIAPAARSTVAISTQPVRAIAGLTPIIADASAGVTVPQAVRTACDQDADAIVLSDIRDAETYPAALEAAASGRLVVAAMDISDPAEVIVRLLETPLDPWLLAAHLKAVVATVPMRRLCPDCRQPGQPDKETLARLGLSEVEVGQTFTAPGCPRCQAAGTVGVTGCTSALVVDRRMASVIRTGPSRAELNEAACQADARPLIQVGLDLVRQGLTSLEELGRALPP